MDALHPDLDERWIGSVFPGKSFEWTGEYLPVDKASPRTRGTQGGGRPIRVWRIREGAVAPRADAWIGPKPDAFQRLPVPEPAVLRGALGEIKSFVNICKKMAPTYAESPELKTLVSWLKQEMRG
jgi:hypothetical protein